MKNYLKVTLGCKNLGIFPFDDMDAESTKDAVDKAVKMKQGYGARIVVWSPSGLAAQHAFAVVGEVPDGRRGFE